MYSTETGFDRKAIARDLRRRQRIWAPVYGVRAARKLAHREAWEFAEACRAIALHDAELSADERSSRDEAIALQCSTDGRLPTTDRQRMHGLQSAA